MESLSAPWRMRYIKGESRTTGDGGCILCDLSRAGVRRDRLVLYRTTLCYIVLNAFPYTSGHLMVVPHAHGGTLASQNPEGLREIMDLLGACEKILEKEYNPSGYNIGINVGKSAGAGIQDHLHAHILPRWEGDTNFMTTIHEVRVLPEELLATYDRLFPHFLCLEEGMKADHPSRKSFP
ncbi:HIT family protein [Leptospirillum ferriphilum]|uniref:Histidine triad (HIT) protein n=3 Tax=Leptospirillum TaxID=179 RepID=A0A094X453_9BACT|nr:HIT domain-containing protein [Leptospirillum ferriphilum]AFS54114.1 putative histidine triad (HIT) protein [Leptospirillum ferriphilum ML-04]EDZ38055.1 MAG: Putative histidine triad (HIT) protein [Leptospirillum sp. Group II '5-way CG']KGA93354.1 histidine triad (HIT) protein [Leptospirillum ferriphilum]